jgi:hypothetical protein
MVTGIFIMGKDILTQEIERIDAKILRLEEYNDYVFNVLMLQDNFHTSRSEYIQFEANVKELEVLRAYVYELKEEWRTFP